MKKFNLKAIDLLIIPIICLILMIVFYTSNGNVKNSISSNTNCVQWFTDTGIDVKNQQNRVYNIIQDPNGWLYYCSDVDGVLSPVFDEFGMPTKSVELFQ